MKYLLVIIALISLTIGAIGVLVPVLPTTPFLLISSFLFAKSSPRFNEWLKNTKIYQNSVQEYQQSKGMYLKTKVQILFVASVMLIFAMIVSNHILATLVILLVMTIKYYFFIFKIKTLKK